MSKRHTITVKELDDYMLQDTWHLFASSGSVHGSQKQIEFSNSGMFRVRDHGEYVYTGKDAGTAVEAYNSAT